VSIREVHDALDNSMLAYLIDTNMTMGFGRCMHLLEKSLNESENLAPFFKWSYVVHLSHV
jgi:hypothetical protein